jgi:hypothetical protein
MLNMEPSPMRRRLRSMLVLSSFGLAACNGESLSTQWKLRKFDPATADIAQVRIAVRPPAWATPTPEKTIVSAKYEFDDGAAGRQLDIRLRRADHAEDRAELERLAPGGGLVVYEAAPGDLGAVRALQSDIEAAKQAGRHGRGAIEAGGSLACRTGEVPEGPVRIDAYIHASDVFGWLPLVEGHDLSASLNANENWRALVPVCEKSASRAAR